MHISERYKKRLMELSGTALRTIINEDVKLTATEGRSGAGTLSWYTEEYLLNLGSSMLTSLDETIQRELNMKLSMSRSSTKMVANSLVTKLIVDGTSKTGQKINPEFTLTVNVNFEQGGNTAGTVTYQGTTDTFNLNSKHSHNDIALFTRDVTNYILNIIKRESKS